MTRTRLVVQNPGDFQPGHFNPDNCGSSLESTFYADLNHDSTCEKIVVRESTYVDVPHNTNTTAPVSFIRHSVITIDVYDVSSLPKFLLSTQHTTARFKDTFEMSLDKFYNDTNGACPPPTFRGLYLVKDGDDRHLEFGAANFTLTSYHSDDGVKMVKETSLKV